MSTFVWVIFILLAIETAGKLYWLATHVPERTRGTVAGDVFFGAALMAWGAWVLAAA